MGKGQVCKPKSASDNKPAGRILLSGLELDRTATRVVHRFPQRGMAFRCRIVSPRVLCRANGGIENVRNAEEVFMKAMHQSHEATCVFHRQQRSASSLPVRLMSLAACAAIAGGAAFSHVGDAVAQPYGTADNQNELPGPVNNITIEMHEGTNMNAFPSPDGTQMVLSLQ